jgi:ornithine decarboxylase
LRHIPQEAWAEVLKHAKCEILSAVESTPAVMMSKKSGKSSSTKGLTGYLLSESSLFVSDHTLTLKTCGRTTPLAALEPILSLVVPNWEKHDPDHYLRYASFLRLGYMRPEEQLEPHTSWQEEVDYMNKHFRGEAVVLGSKATSAQHVYIANYLPKGEVSDVFSTQVALTELDPSQSMRRYGRAPAGGRSPVQAAPLKHAWESLHGSEKRSAAANPILDECFFEPIGYSANGVFGRYFTSIHITPQPVSSYLSVETSLPLTHEARQSFVEGSESLCPGAGKLVLTEFALSPSLFNAGTAPEIPGFTLEMTSQTVGHRFACAFHTYTRCIPQLLSQHIPQRRPSPLNELTRNEEDAAASECESAEERLEPLAQNGTAPPTPVFSVADSATAPVAAALSLLEKADCTAFDSFHAKLADAPVALVDKAALWRRVALWRRLLPRVEPFYAVKCNPHTAVIKSLLAAWKEYGFGGFDCASPAEIELVAALGANTEEQVIFANPCKQASAIKFAHAAGVRLLAFDNIAELEKIHALHQEADLVLRIQTDDAFAQCPLSNKFGAAPADYKALLDRARALKLHVVGISFHVGSGCSERGAFRTALQRARAAFDVAEMSGFTPTLLDIGGGFPGFNDGGNATFESHATDISELLEELFPSPAVKVIAEPGRFFAATAQAMLTEVISVAEAPGGNRYYLNDGLYGSFNCLLYDHAKLEKPLVIRRGHILEEEDESTHQRPCTLFGPTCDGFDVLSESMALPLLKVGDRLLFCNMGAYTSAASTSFNGFAPASCFVYESRLLAEEKLAV